MGFFGSMLSAAVKTLTIPVAVVKDVVNVAADEEPSATERLVDSIVDDVDDAIDSIT